MSIEVFNTDFYPRSPCGERLWATCGPAGGRTFLSTLSLRRATASGFLIGSRSQFLSTLSLRRATRGRFLIFYLVLFLSTLSLRRATFGRRAGLPVAGHFYPRSPCGERLVQMSIEVFNTDFYPRSPCGERQKHIQK